MKTNIHARKLNRLSGYDYTNPGYYFVTICTHNREHYFGHITNKTMKYSQIGCVTDICWNNIPSHFPYVSLDEYVIMPNHIHGIIVIRPFVGNEYIRSLQKTNTWHGAASGTLSSIIRGVKIGVTKCCQMNNIPFHWQKSFHDHIIRNEQSLYKIRWYIRNNPVSWTQ